VTDATVVIVNYRSGKHLAGCLESVMADPPARVIVVDNASGDASFEPAARWAERDPRVELVVSPTNLGLAGAVDLVLESITTPYLIPLNPDTVVHAGWWQRLVAALEADSRTAVACPLVLIQGSQTVNSAGQHLHVTGLGFNRMLGQPASVVPAFNHPVPGLHGTAFAIRTGALRQIGGWDATGFLYHEDVALSWSLRLAGLEIVCVPWAVVEHDYHLTMSPDKLHLLERNRWAMLLAHLRPGTLLLLSLPLLLTEAMVLALCVRRGPRFLAAKARSWRWVWGHRSEIRVWRRRVQSLRMVPDRRVLAALRWSYPLGQATTLARETGPSTRVPPGGLPTGMSD
jgi:GT2 family glycosyltransferase